MHRGKRGIRMICTKCGSNNVTSHAVTEQTTEGKTKGFGWIKACLGTLIAGPFGFLCGLCGMGKGKSKTTSETKVINVCQDCGNQF